MRITHNINLPAGTVFDIALEILQSFERQMSQCVAPKFMTAQVSFRFSYQRSNFPELCLIACLIKVTPRSESVCELMIDADGFGTALNMGNQQFFLAHFTKLLEGRLSL